MTAALDALIEARARQLAAYQDEAYELDPFGWQHERRMERGLIAEYEQDLTRALDALRPETLDIAAELAELPSSIRGYGPVKLESWRKAQDRRKELPHRPSAPPLVVAAEQIRSDCMAEAPISILGAARTPIGSLLGELSPVKATRLGAIAIEGALGRAGIGPEGVGNVVMGNVLSAGLGQAPARQAALGAGLPNSVPCTTINKMCGSGMQALILAHDTLAAGGTGIHVAGGMESMSNAPFLLPRARAGMKFGHGQVLDHMALDGLEDAYEPGRLMGTYAEDTAQQLGISRADQDSYAERSLRLAQEAGANAALRDEIVDVAVPGRKGDLRISTDEQPRKADLSKIPSLRPAFREGGTVTAANSSSISDGAAALVIGRESDAVSAPLARIVAHAVHAQQPAWFTTAPVAAIRKVLAKAGWTLDEVDLFEINEAFAVVVLATQRELGLPLEKVNVRGGACAVGHPIGASGARIIVTLLAALRQRGLKRGVAAVCIGGGEATAVALEMAG